MDCAGRMTGHSTDVAAADRRNQRIARVVRDSYVAEVPYLAHEFAGVDLWQRRTSGRSGRR